MIRISPNDPRLLTLGTKRRHKAPAEPRPLPDNVYPFDPHGNVDAVPELEALRARVARLEERQARQHPRPPSGPAPLLRVADTVSRASGRRVPGPPLRRPDAAAGPVIDMQAEFQATLDANMPIFEDMLRTAVRDELLNAPADPNRLVDAGEAAQMLGMTETAVRRAANRGTLPSRKNGKLLRFRVGDLLQHGYGTGSP
jgi:hypothetical protein